VSERYPEFYGRARSIAVRDPLAEFLGAAEGGVIELPERGGVRVELRGALDEGTTGVVANVAALVTGAAGEGGFKGIAGRFVRRGLLAFGAPIGADLRFTRLATGHAVEVDLRHPAPMSGELSVALRRVLSPGASTQDRAAFAEGWQERVAGLLA
jgi:hypothetical protein